MHIEKRNRGKLQRYSVVDQRSADSREYSSFEEHDAIMKGRGFLRYDRPNFQITVMELKVELGRVEIIALTVGSNMPRMRWEAQKAVNKSVAEESEIDP